MTTRSLTAVRINSEYKIANYGHFDGYPAGQGVDTLKFLTTIMNKDKFIKKLSNLRYSETDEEWQEANKRQEKIDGVGILKYVQNRKDNIVNDNLEFAKDALFCEWAYVIDFDTNTFDVYTRHSAYKTEFCKKENKPEFENLILLKRYDLNNLPSENDFTTDLIKD